MIPPGSCLDAVVQLIRQIRRVIRMQHRRARILVRPHDAVRRAARGHRRRRPWIGKRSPGLRTRCNPQLRRRNRESLQRPANVAVVNRAVEIRRSGPDASRQRAINLLLNVVA